HAASKFRVECRPAVQNIYTSWKTVSVDVIGSHQTNREPQLAVAHTGSHVNASGKRQVSRPESKGILMKCQTLRRCRVCSPKDVDRGASTRSCHYVLEWTGDDNRRRDVDGHVAGTIRSSVCRRHKLSQGTSGLLVLRVDRKDTSGARADCEDVALLQSGCG